MTFAPYLSVGAFFQKVFKKVILQKNASFRVFKQLLHFALSTKNQKKNQFSWIRRMTFHVFMIKFGSLSRPLMTHANCVKIYFHEILSSSLKLNKMSFYIMHCIT